MSTHVKLNNNQGDVSIIKHLDTDTPQGDFILDVRQLKLGSTPIPDRASLKALKGLKDGDVVYQSDIDLVYVYEASNTEDDNGGTIIEPDSGVGRLVARYNGAVNVKWFGAKGDGNVETTLIQKAFNLGEKVVSDKDKTYLVDNVLTILNNSIIDFNSSTIKLDIISDASMSNRGIIELQDKATPHNIDIRNLKVDGNRYNQPSVIIGTNSISGFKLFANDTVRVQGLKMHNCEANNCTNSGFTGAADNFEMSFCNASNNMAIGFLIGSPANGTSNNCKFTNLFGFNNGDDIYAISGSDNFFFQSISNSTFSDIHGDYTTATQGTGFKLATCYNNILSNILMRNSPWQGVHIQESSFNTFSNVVCTNSSENGVSITSVNDNDCIDNVIVGYAFNNNKTGLLVSHDVVNYPTKQSSRNKFYSGEMLDNTDNIAIIDSNQTVIKGSILGGSQSGATSSNGILLQDLGLNAITLDELDISDNTIQFCNKAINIGVNVTLGVYNNFDNTINEIAFSGYANNVEDWQIPTLLDTWENNVSNREVLQFRKKGSRVEIKGVTQSGTQGTTVFNLPDISYAPVQRIDFLVGGGDPTAVKSMIIVSNSVINGLYPGGEMDIRIEYDTK